ncbi:hypothetical protein DFAR_2690028 [Desulfarculales bacterium]
MEWVPHLPWNRSSRVITGPLETESATWRLEATGVADFLEQGSIDLLYLTHEHMDHFWGLEAVLKRASGLTMMVLSTLSIKALEFIFGGASQPAGVRNRCSVEGRVRRWRPGRAQVRWVGYASVPFD